jgi:hypothetical protein
LTWFLFSASFTLKFPLIFLGFLKFFKFPFTLKEVHSWGCAQVIECLPSKQASGPEFKLQYCKNKKKKIKNKEFHSFYSGFLSFVSFDFAILLLSKK